MKNSVGSAILTVIISITLIMIIAGTIMRNATLFHDFAVQRVIYERRTRALQALLNYGIAWCTVINGFKEKNPTYQKTFNFWPPGNQNASGEITIECKPESLYVVKVYINRPGTARETESCLVRKYETWCVTH